MNERIKELADQALKECDAAKERGIDQYSKRFAELIIRECAEVANAHDCNHSGNDGAILNYFGVK
jgi:hypothetical protein